MKRTYQGPSDFDRARDELFSHIHRCGVLRATPEQQTEWMGETMVYIGERYPSLSRADLGRVQQIGLRFCQPVSAHPVTSEPQDQSSGATPEAAEEAETAAAA